MLRPVFYLSVLSHAAAQSCGDPSTDCNLFIAEVRDIPQRRHSTSADIPPAASSYCDTF
jgi:hypothetical protein